MLVLSRKVGQGCRLGDDIRITIVKVDRNSVRIGIEAGDHVSVRREEIVELQLAEESPRQAGIGVA